MNPLLKRDNSSLTKQDWKSVPQIVFLLVCVLSLIFLSFSQWEKSFAAERVPPTLPLASSLSQELIQATDKGRASVVNIIVKSRASDSTHYSFLPFLGHSFVWQFFQTTPDPQEDHPLPGTLQQSAASGVIVSSDGYIITNHHVIERAYDIRVQLHDHRLFPVKVIGIDPQTDLALLKIKASNLPALKWGNSSLLKVGEIVVAIGNPFGLNQTVTMGIVSAIGRADVGFIDYEDFIQTDAAINPGNSGGALLNLKGELVGINTAIFTEGGGDEGIGFAVPSQIAKAISTLLQEHGRVIRGWLGLTVQRLTPLLAPRFNSPDTKGVIITDLANEGPAAQANLKRGDIIRHYNKTLITTPYQLHSLIAGTKPGTSVKISRLRDGLATEVKVRVIERKSEKAQGETINFTQHGMALDGVEVDPISSDLKKQVQGVVVSEIIMGSYADKSGLEEGDIILEVNDKQVESVKLFEQIVSRLKKEQAVLLLLRRANTNMFLIVGPSE